jgi:hypothetical protein
MTPKPCQENAYRLADAASMDDSYRFSLDFCMNQTDNYIVITVLDLIYSPSDMPQGLWRGFAFIGNAGRVGYAC